MSVELIRYQGSCHCGSVKFSFHTPEIKDGVRCNCSICSRKNGIMSVNAFSPDEMMIDISDDSLARYKFGSGVAQHFFCNRCGIYTFHKTKRQPGFYRVNLSCVEGLDASRLPYTIFDGASL